MAPPLRELGLMAMFLGITALVSVIAGYIAYRLGWMTLSPTLRWSLLGGYTLSSLLTFFNVWFSAQMMFASQHDLLLAIVLLIFASGMAMVSGDYFYPAPLQIEFTSLKMRRKNLPQGTCKHASRLLDVTKLPRLQILLIKWRNNLKWWMPNNANLNACART